MENWRMVTCMGIDPGTRWVHKHKHPHKASAFDPGMQPPAGLRNFAAENLNGMRHRRGGAGVGIMPPLQRASGRNSVSSSVPWESPRNRDATTGPSRE